MMQLLILVYASQHLAEQQLMQLLRISTVFR